MFFRKPKPVQCAVCGKTIEPREGRFVDRNRATKTERHTHLTCAADSAPGGVPGARTAPRRR
jgi:hypothetical protein